MSAICATKCATLGSTYGKPHVSTFDSAQYTTKCATDIISVSPADYAAHKPAVKSTYSSASAAAERATNVRALYLAFMSAEHSTDSTANGIPILSTNNAAFE